MSASDELRYGAFLATIIEIEERRWPTTSCVLGEQDGPLDGALGEA